MFLGQLPSPPRETDDFETDEEYNAPFTNNFNMANVGDNADTNGEGDIIQHGESDNNYADLVMVLSEQVNIDVVKDQEVINKALINTQELYVG